MKGFFMFYMWFVAQFNFGLIFVPLAFSNILIDSDPFGEAKGTKWIGYFRVYIFGFRILQIQKTKPWS